MSEAIVQALLGTWRMTSWQFKDAETGETMDALGPEPQGYINYSPEGRVMVLVLRSGRAKPTQTPPTDQEKMGLYDTMFAYSGTYAVDDEKVTHRIDMSWNEAWTGTEQIRFHRLEGRVLHLTSAPARNPLNGRDGVFMVVFEKLSQPG